MLKICSALLFMVGVSTCCWAQSPVSLADAVRKSIVENPEVQESWNAFLSATEEQKVARGRYFPQLDLTAGAGWEKSDQFLVGENESTPSNVALSLSQLVFDGFATRHEVARLGYARLARYYQILSVSEQVGLEAVRAYLDVLRYRQLVGMATENLARHREIFTKVQQRAQAGVGRGVDLEQAAGRLALSESNRLTEISNLQDVSARYLRIVGELPATTLEQPDPLSEGVPSQLSDTLNLAFQESPAFNAAVENVRAAEEEAKVRKAAFSPRLDFRARQNFGRDQDDIEDRNDETVVEVVLSYNLFRGGSDAAAVRQYYHRLDLFKAQRERTCRDLRQTLTIAFNDSLRLEDQLRYLNEHQLSTEKVRHAYRDQFDIGQRTLLDLLDTENEYFQSRRAHLNAKVDHAISRARILSAMGRLLRVLEVSRADLPSIQTLNAYRREIDPDVICPAEGIEHSPAPPSVSAPAVTVPSLSQRLAAQVAPTNQTAPANQTTPLAAPSISPPPAAPSDGDGDGVPDAKDSCPASPHGTKVDGFGCPEVARFTLHVQFPTASAVIPKEFDSEIANFAKLLRRYPDARVTLEGHTDSIGTSEANRKLSQARAESVRTRLIEAYDIPPDRVRAVGFGEARPLAGNESQAGRFRNRRVDAVFNSSELRVNSEDFFTRKPPSHPEKARKKNRKNPR